MQLNQDKVLMLVLSKYKCDPRPRRQAEALAASGKQVEVLYGDPDGDKNEEVFNGVKLKRVRFLCFNSRFKASYIFNYVMFLISSFIYLNRRFFAAKPQTIVIHSMPNCLVFNAFLAKWLGARVILDVHDLMPELYKSIFKQEGGFLHKLLLLEERISCRFASCVMTANDLFAQTLQKRVGRSFFIVHNSPDPKVLSGEQRPQNHNGKLTLFHHGNIHKRCGIDRILPSLGVLKLHHPQIELQVHGRGPFYDVVKADAKALELEDSCVFGEGFELEKLPDLLQDADIGLVINRICDFTTLCMPIKLLEYVECKLPVICSRMKTANFYFDDSMVYYFDSEEQLADIVDHIIAHPEEAKQKAERAYSKYLEIAWPTMQRQYVHYIEQPA